MNALTASPAALKLGAFTVVSLLVLVMLYNTMTGSVSGGTTEYRAVFSDVNGLRTGDDVRLAGVKVGKVTGFSVRDGRAEVTFDVISNQALATTDHLTMRYQNLVGQRYLAVVPGKNRSTRQPPEQTVGMSRTDPGFDLTALLNGFRPLFAVLSPDDINKLSTSMIKVLQGEGGTVDALLQETTRLTNFLADRQRLFNEVAVNLTPVLQEMAGDGSTLSSTVTRFARLTVGLAADRKTFGRSVDSLAGLLDTTDSLVTRIREPLRRDIAALRRVLRLYAAHSRQYAESTPALAGILATLGRSMSYRSALTAYVCSLTVSADGVDLATPTPPGKVSEVCR